MFGFMLYGLGIGMGYYPILKTTWKYFPEKKGFLTGFILSVFGLCPMAFTSIADAVINPEGKSMVNDIFPEEVANNMKTFALIMAITMGICGILSQILMFPLDNIITTDKNTDETNKNKQVSYVPNEIFDSEKIEEKELTEETEQKIEDINEPFNQAFKSWRFHLFNIMSVGTLCKFILIYKKNILIYIVFGFFSTNTSRPFGSKKLGNREIELQTMSKVCGLLNGVFRIIWGFVYDWLGFKIPYTIVTTLQVGVSATFYFSASNIYTYYITNILENLVFSGHGTIAPPIVSKIFGMKNTVTLLGITGYYIGTAGFLGAIIAKFVIKEDEDFLIVYWIGCGFAIMGWIICMFTKEDKFIYMQIEEEVQNQEENHLIKPSVAFNENN